MTETLTDALPETVERLTTQVLRAAARSEMRLTTAESCTGGLLASLLTDVKGCSHVFDRGFVVYSDEAKHQMLGVPQTVLETHGAVSETVARAMAEGALARSAATVAAAVTGYADGSTPDGEAGLVHFAVARSGADTRHLLRRFGDIGRGPCRMACLEVALAMMLDALPAER